MGARFLFSPYTPLGSLFIGQHWAITEMFFVGRGWGGRFFEGGRLIGFYLPETNRVSNVSSVVNYVVSPE